ncbi:MAG TPA: Uma2 family endonuclease [Planctomycetota bacterium]|nr:Uma2 family endonuclease [Planctomycetota bacterium]
MIAQTGSFQPALVRLDQMLHGMTIAPLTVEQHRTGRIELLYEHEIDPSRDFRFNLVQLTVDLYHVMKDEQIIPANEHIELLNGIMFWVDRRDAQPRPVPRELVALTIEQYHRMSETGIIPSGTPIELIEGLLVWKNRSARGENFMTIGNYHRICVRLLMDLTAKLNECDCDLFLQAPLQMPDRHEPEPDGYIVKGSMKSYLSGHPRAEDAWSVIEVSDSSLETDRHEKLQLYARAGIPQYIIVNIAEMQIEVYEQPVRAERRYAHSVTRKPGENVSFLVGSEKRLEVPAQSILP